MRLLKWILGIIVIIIGIGISREFVSEAIGTICYKKGIRAFYGMDMQFVGGMWIPKDSRNLYSNIERDYKGAISKFEIARKLGVEKLSSTLFIAASYNNLGQYEKSIEYAKEILQIDPLNDDAGRGLVSSLGFLGRYDEAEKVALKRASYLPYRDDAYYQLAEIYAMQKDFKKAYFFAERSIYWTDLKRRFIDDRIGRRFLLMHIAHDYGDHEGAIKVLREIIQLNPKEPGAYMNLAEVYEKIGNKKEAITNWDKVLEMGAEYFPADILAKAKQKIQQLESELKQQNIS